MDVVAVPTAGFLGPPIPLEYIPGTPQHARFVEGNQAIAAMLQEKMEAVFGGLFGSASQSAAPAALGGREQSQGVALGHSYRLPSLSGREFEQEKAHFAKYYSSEQLEKKIETLVAQANSSPSSDHRDYLRSEAAAALIVLAERMRSEAAPGSGGRNAALQGLSDRERALVHPTVLGNPGRAGNEPRLGKLETPIQEQKPLILTSPLSELSFPQITVTPDQSELGKRLNEPSPSPALEPSKHVVMMQESAELDEALAEKKVSPHTRQALEPQFFDFAKSDADLTPGDFAKLPAPDRRALVDLFLEARGPDIRLLEQMSPMLTALERLDEIRAIDDRRTELNASVGEIDQALAPSKHKSGRKSAATIALETRRQSVQAQVTALNKDYSQVKGEIPELEGEVRAQQPAAQRAVRKSLGEVSEQTLQLAEGLLERAQSYLPPQVVKSQAVQSPADAIRFSARKWNERIQYLSFDSEVFEEVGQQRDSLDIKAAKSLLAKGTADLTEAEQGQFVRGAIAAQRRRTSPALSEAALEHAEQWLTVAASPNQALAADVSTLLRKFDPSERRQAALYFLGMAYQDDGPLQQYVRSLVNLHQEHATSIPGLLGHLNNTSYLSELRQANMEALAASGTAVSRGQQELLSNRWRVAVDGMINEIEAASHRQRIGKDIVGLALDSRDLKLIRSLGMKPMPQGLPDTEIDIVEKDRETGKLQFIEVKSSADAFLRKNQVSGSIQHHRQKAWALANGTEVLTMLTVGVQVSGIAREVMEARLLIEREQERLAVPTQLQLVDLRTDETRTVYSSKPSADEAKAPPSANLDKKRTDR